MHYGPFESNAINNGMIATKADIKYTCYVRGFWIILLCDVLHKLDQYRKLTGYN